MGQKHTPAFSCQLSVPKKDLKYSIFDWKKMTLSLFNLASEQLNTIECFLKITKGVHTQMHANQISEKQFALVPAWSAWQHSPFLIRSWMNSPSFSGTPAPLLTASEPPYKTPELLTAQAGSGIAALAGMYSSIFQTIVVLPPAGCQELVKSQWEDLLAPLSPHKQGLPLSLRRAPQRNPTGTRRLPEAKGAVGKPKPCRGVPLSLPGDVNSSVPTCARGTLKSK